MIGVGIQFDRARLERYLASLPTELREQLPRRMLQAAQYLTGQIRTTIKANVERARGGLARSFRPKFLGREGSILNAGSFSDLRYARIQDEGGTIRPRTGRALAVPLSFAKVPPGKWPRHFNDLHFMPRPGKPPLLVKYKIKEPGKGKEGPAVLNAIEPKFVLLPKVQIKAKRYLEKAELGSRDGIADILVNGIKEANDEAAGGR